MYLSWGGWRGGGGLVYSRMRAQLSLCEVATARDCNFKNPLTTQNWRQEMAETKIMLHGHEDVGYSLRGGLIVPVHQIKWNEKSSLMLNQTSKITKTRVYKKCFFFWKIYFGLIWSLKRFKISTSKVEESFFMKWIIFFINS